MATHDIGADDVAADLVTAQYPCLGTGHDQHAWDVESTGQEGVPRVFLARRGSGRQQSRASRPPVLSGRRDCV